MARIKVFNTNTQSWIYADKSFGKDGESITITNITESSDDGGSNVVTFSDGKTLTVKNGRTGGKGDPGTTPTRGVDYWTDDDQEDMVQQVITALGTPVFGRVDAENNIILTGELADGTYTIKYEDAEGNVTEIGTLEQGASYTNLADPTSSDWLTDIRLNSSAVETEQIGAVTTNYIPLKAGEVVRVKGLNIFYMGTGNSTTHFYNGSKAHIGKTTPAAQEDVFDNSGFNPPTKEEFKYTVGTGSIAFNTGYSAENIAFMRFVGVLLSGYTANDVVITVNQEITD